MRVSILIISKNRKEELFFTLRKLKSIVDLSVHEILVLLDGCTDSSEELVQQFDWINWTVLNESIGASRARNFLYKKATGDIFIGFDDDAHPLQDDFIKIVESIFEENNNLGIIAFQEIKGVFKNDGEALSQKPNQREEYLCNEFVGCGFAITKGVYLATNGFPVWIDIYGEESCVAVEVLANKKDILYTNRVSVNHRVNKQARLNSGMNYFRFEKQLKNTAFYFIVYHENPSLEIIKLLWHNFKKYALKDITFFKSYFKVIGIVIVQVPRVLKYRKPVSKSIIKEKKELASPIFY
ncbi:glycosyltransferase family 2 protein [Flavobacterium sp. GT3P67]|uniref:glycosyltransferase family 2 protein n=1 Tax=Flavobacterium sp. GT3P67 TaxID=2541722 RepID=UPI001043452F|nr:glycosyltransferase family 2 protein [Flavobacterium sp. GT3P67]TDE53936.1 glycosyltransferase family 2 protein [Flavobacterium sp. GT3P67]